MAKKKGETARKETRGPRQKPWLLGGLGLLALLIVAAAASWRWQRETAFHGPIVLISIDTLRADHLPVYGYSKVRTPTIDALASDGIVFEHAYAHSPQTLPSHASILTGKLPFETGVRDNIGFALRPEVPTLASVLTSHGFATAGIASAFVLRPETGIGRGFDFYDAKMPPEAPDRPMGEVQRNGEASWAVARAWLEGRPSPDLFLFFHIYEPHTPYTPPARFGQYAPYDGEIAYSDEIVGRLIAWLKERGWYDRAAIILLSDHGEGLGDHGEQEHGLFLYNATVHVPLVVKLPRGTAAGRRIATPVQHIDLVPTILDWIGAARPAGLRGRSLTPLLDRGEPAAFRDDSLYAEAFYGRYHFGWSELYSLTDARYRYIRAPRPELYDLQKDAGERVNLAAERPTVVTAARGALDRLVAADRPGQPGSVSQEDLARLQALGYVGTQASVDAGRSGESLPDPKDKAAVLEAFRAAIQASGARDYDKAIALLRSVVKDSPGMKDAWQQLGIELVHAGRREEAIAPFKRVVELDPNDANSFVTVASALAALGRYAEARANALVGLEKAQPASGRTRASACEVLVSVALAENDAAAARRYAKVAQETDPSFPLASYVEGRLLHREGKFAEALPLFQEAVRRLQGSPLAIPQLYYYEGDTLANLEREAEAEAAFKEEIRLFPQSVEARSHLAVLYRAMNRDADANRVVDELLRSSPTPEGYSTAARVWTIVGEPARAAAVREEASRRFRR